MATGRPDLSPEGKFYQIKPECMQPSWQPLSSLNSLYGDMLVLSKPDHEGKVICVDVTDTTEYTTQGGEIRDCYPMRSSTIDYDGSQLNVKNFLNFGSWSCIEESYLMLEAFPLRFSFENLTPRYATRTESQFFTNAEGTDCHRVTNVREHVSLTTASLAKVHEMMDKMQVPKKSELKHANREICKLKQKIASMQLELEDRETAASELRRNIRLSLGTGHTARKTVADGPGRFFTFKPQAGFRDHRGYQDIPRGARGHMVVVLDSPDSEGKVHVVTVTSNDQVTGVEFCPIAPTPRGSHRLQAHMIYSLDMFADVSRLGNSYLRMEPLLIPWDMLTPVIGKLSKPGIPRNIQPCLREPSLNKVLAILRGT